MNDKDELKGSNSLFLIPLSFVILIWLVYWVEIKFGFNFNKYGVFPRTLKGVRGVILSPFIHSDTSHLFNNSIPLFVLSSILFFFYNKVADKVLIYGGLLTGILTWLIAREAHHIGASGIVYLLFSFTFFSGIIKKHFRLIAVSLVIIFLYGSMVWYVLPIKEGMSWEGHLSGFLIGSIFSFIFRKEGIVKENFQFSKTEFDEMFDDEGNYLPPEIIDEEEIESLKEINYKYIYIEEE